MFQIWPERQGIIHQKSTLERILNYSRKWSKQRGNWPYSGKLGLGCVLRILRIPKSVGSGTLWALYGGLPGRNRILANRCEGQKISENRKKSQKSIFLKVSKMASRGPRVCPGMLLGPFGTSGSDFWPFRKNWFFDFFRIFFRFSEIFCPSQRFANFRYRPGRPP